MRNFNTLKLLEIGSFPEDWKTSFSVEILVSIRGDMQNISPLSRLDAGCEQPGHAEAGCQPWLSASQPETQGVYIVVQYISREGKFSYLPGTQHVDSAVP